MATKHLTTDENADAGDISVMREILTNIGTDAIQGEALAKSLRLLIETGAFNEMVGAELASIVRLIEGRFANINVRVDDLSLAA